jgi:hypothetical protein
VPNARWGAGDTFTEEQCGGGEHPDRLERRDGDGDRHAGVLQRQVEGDQVGTKEEPAHQHGSELLATQADAPGQHDGGVDGEGQPQPEERQAEPVDGHGRHQDVAAAPQRHRQHGCAEPGGGWLRIVTGTLVGRAAGGRPARVAVGQIRVGHRYIRWGASMPSRPRPRSMTRSVPIANDNRLRRCASLGALRMGAAS